ncbi:hypothetical protein BKA82DRAFT_27184 [Pisolithus tinctorius]|uniref:Uncharacterized protein n=1 Tax=Pisolithus tinctorius Marx 270 TaxID=870435 RepID=A0A0C3K0S3_PISTI|nr:hypothetical protein BKA82DRAFT_27184 [Pisolithus tinctorius]KIO03197.1 hypothetical protein M404DRAFT_27184 [Pisolithus tinctorius Marx 270]
MKHYYHLICQFGTPNSLCSSITESKHIKAVKQPYQHTNCFQALGQMLLINQRLNKLITTCANFKENGVQVNVPMMLMIHATKLGKAKTWLMKLKNKQGVMRRNWVMLLTLPDANWFKYLRT